jgi:hypothetical protein
MASWLSPTLHPYPEWTRRKKKRDTEDKLDTVLGRAVRAARLYTKAAGSIENLSFLLAE